MYLISIGDITSSANTCTRIPKITGIYRYRGILVPVYNVTWQSFSCQFRDITQYQIQFAERCPVTGVMTLSTGSNQTSAVISIPSCEIGRCYVRVRAQLLNGSFSDYSACVLITHQLFQHESMPDYNNIAIEIKYSPIFRQIDYLLEMFHTPISI